jgi:hypothetical protein
MSDELKKTLADLVSPGQNGSDTKQTATPESWRPRVELGPDGGFVISTANAEGNTPGAEEILRERGLDPAEWTVTSVRKGSWQTFHGDWLESVRVNVIPTRGIAERDFDLEQLVDHIRSGVPKRESRLQQAPEPTLTLVLTSRLVKSLALAELTRLWAASSRGLDEA